MNQTKLSVILFVCSEVVFFTLLILAYLYFHGAPANGPTAATSLNPEITGIFSIFLFASSFTVWRVGKNMQSGNHTRLKVWLGITIAFGATFLCGQGIEWTHMMSHGATISRNLFGTTFFTLTGFHGLHVFVGLILLSILLTMGFRGFYKVPHSSTTVEVISIYWHFVDAVWVVIFSVVYLGVIK